VITIFGADSNRSIVETPENVSGNIRPSRFSSGSSVGIDGAPHEFYKCWRLWALGDFAWPSLEGIPSRAPTEAATSIPMRHDIVQSLNSGSEVNEYLGNEYFVHDAISD